MQKRGFTMIEVMVVVVIVGILAAVAVPKLFGMAAKSKAAEVMSAAGTYIRQQDAFITEHRDSIGSWKSIGYSMHNSSNFNYYEGTMKVSDKGYAENSKDVQISKGLSFAWVAGNVSALNDCKPDAYWGAWRISVSQSSTGNLAAYTADVGDSDCENLTPNFKNLTTK